MIGPWQGKLRLDYVATKRLSKQFASGVVWWLLDLPGRFHHP